MPPKRRRKRLTAPRRRKRETWVTKAKEELALPFKCVVCKNMNDITLKACKTCGKAAPVRPTIEELAAKKLQGMFRSRKALMYIRLLLRATVEKLYDKETGFYYYYNKSTGEAQ